MSDKKVFHLKSFEKLYGFAQAVEINKTLYISGTVSIDDDGDPTNPGDMKAQTRSIYNDIKQVLEAHGATFSNVIKEAMFTTDIELFKTDALPVRAEFYQGHSLPAAAPWVQVERLAFPEFLVEIEVTASIP